MFKGQKYWRKKAQKNLDRAHDISIKKDQALSLLHRFVQTLEVDGFGHVKDIHAGDATEIYHEYLNNFITKN